MKQLDSNAVPCELLGDVGKTVFLGKPKPTRQFCNVKQTSKKQCKCKAVPWRRPMAVQKVLPKKADYAMRDVAFSCYAGEIVGLLGHNGATFRFNTDKQQFMVSQPCEANVGVCNNRITNQPCELLGDVGKTVFLGKPKPTRQFCNVKQTSKKQGKYKVVPWRRPRGCAKGTPQKPTTPWVT